MRLARWGLVLLWFFFSLNSISSADKLIYLYDDTGRLTRVLKGTEGSSYQYDQVGNLISISKNTVSANPPVLQSVNPNVQFIGYKILTTLAGQNLFTADKVISDNPNISTKILAITDTTIKAEITISSSALPATANLFVTTLYGTSNAVPITLSSSILTFSPGQLVLLPSSVGSINAAISPPVGQVIVITVGNSRPSVISTPEFVTIPSSGATSFTVTAGQKGISTVSAGSSNSVVFVQDPYTPAPGEEVYSPAKPVSVQLNVPEAIRANAVSVQLNAPEAIRANAVSVQLNTPEAIQANPVSVYINQDPIVVSKLVSVIISAQ